MAQGEKDDNKGGDGASGSEKKIPIHLSIPHDPYYNFYWEPTAAPKHDHGKDERKKTTVVMKVPGMCCGACETTVRVALDGWKGVESVTCDRFRRRVTAVLTTAAPADILMECKKHFKASRMWTDDD